MCHDVLDGGVALAMLEPALTCRIDHGARHRMRKMLLQASGKAQDLVLAPAIGGEYAGKTRLRLGERAGLIKDNGIGLGKRLKVLGALDHHAHLGGIAHGGHDGDRTRELERARVVDHQCREVLMRLRVVSATRPASRKFHGTILLARSSHVRLALGL